MGISSDFSLRGPCKLVREMAIPRYPSYPVFVGIAGQPCLWGGKYGGLVLQVGVGHEADSLTP
jgi:hypothetical protein